MINYIRLIFGFLGWLCHFFYNRRIEYFIYTCKREFITQLMRSTFASFGNSLLGVKVRFIYPQYIYIGDGCSIGDNAELGCNNSITKKPKLRIGNGVTIGTRVHIACANEVTIGDHCIVSRQTLITDNAHGASSREIVEIPPMARPIVSHGPVIIEDNVWIGEKASIMPNVRIGKGAIVAANAVVTKDVPAYSVVAGIPAKVVKQL